MLVLCCCPTNKRKENASKCISMCHARNLFSERAAHMGGVTRLGGDQERFVSVVPKLAIGSFRKVVTILVTLRHSARVTRTCVKS